MQGNIDAMFVGNEFPDSWVELYNDSQSPIDLKGWSLSPTSNADDGYIIPISTIIEPSGFTIIYCDKEAKGLHSNFRLKAGKGEIYLRDAQSNLRDQLFYPGQPAPEISYGLTSDNDWGHLLTSTPSQKNCDKICETVLPQPYFSKQGHVVTDTFTLKITLPENENVAADTRLCVTTDGREPTLADTVTDNVFELDIIATTAVRAKLISDHALCSRSVTQTYILLDEPTELPIISITTDSCHFYDPATGIFYGEVDNNPNWEKDWRRPINIEFYSGGDHSQTINQMAECRVQGGYSRREAQKSLTVYAHKRFGKSNISTDGLWPDKPELTKVESLILRNAGGDCKSAHIRDAFAQTLLARNTENLDYQAYRPCIYFENGIYKGLYDIRERSNDDNITSNYPEITDFDMIENWGDVKTGSLTRLNRFVDMLIDDDTSYQHVIDELEVDAFLNQYVMQCFAMNTDYPHNNIALWREHGEDTKWHVFLKDVDRFVCSWMNINTNEFQHIHDMANDSIKESRRRAAALHNFFMTNSEARQDLIKRFVVNLGDFMQPQAMKALLREMTDEIRPEIERHHKAWKKYYSANNAIKKWYNEVDEFLPNAFSLRRKIVYDQLSEFFALDSAQNLEIQTNGFETALYGKKLSQPTFKGKFFRSYPIELEIDDNTFAIITETNGIDTIRTDFSGPEFRYTPKADNTSVTIRITDNISTIEEVCIDQINDTPQIYDLLGRRASGKGLRIVNGRKILLK